MEFKRLEEFGLNIKTNECIRGLSNVDLLGHNIFIEVSKTPDISAPSVPHTGETTQLTSTNTVAADGTQMYSLNNCRTATVPTFYKIYGKNNCTHQLTIMTCEDE
uniref:Uncharacterized protein n=1 Tax=Glossina pallidipes TaxID=7398 RepID=A0A1B0A209_GLOPL